MAKKNVSKSSAGTGSAKIDSAVKRKFDISLQIHKLRAELAKQNKELVRLGADARFISFW